MCNGAGYELVPAVSLRRRPHRLRRYHQAMPVNKLVPICVIEHVDNSRSGVTSRNGRGTFRDIRARKSGISSIRSESDLKIRFP